MTANAEDRSAEFPSAADAAGALDLLLSAAALGTARMLRPDAATLRLAVGLARRPQTFARRMSGLTADALLSDAGLSWRDSERIKLLALNVTAAASPSNNPLVNPAAFRALRESGGRSALRRARAVVVGPAAAPRVPW